MYISIMSPDPNVLTDWFLGYLNEILDQVIFKMIWVTDGWDICGETDLIGMLLDSADGKSTLVQVMAWCCQAPSDGTKPSPEPMFTHIYVTKWCH